jgi:hypothetical protein
VSSCVQIVTTIFWAWTAVRLARNSELCDDGSEGGLNDATDGPRAAGSAGNRDSWSSAEERSNARVRPGERFQFESCWRIGEPLPLGLYRTGDSVLP